MKMNYDCNSIGEKGTYKEKHSRFLKDGHRSTFQDPTTKKIKIVPSGNKNRTPYTKTARTRTQESLQPFGETRQKQKEGSDLVTGAPGRQQDPAARRRSKYGKEVMGIEKSRLKRLDWGKLINLDQENIPSNKDKK